MIMGESRVAKRMLIRSIALKERQRNRKSTSTRPQPFFLSGLLGEVVSWGMKWLRDPTNNRLNCQLG